LEGEGAETAILEYYSMNGFSDDIVYADDEGEEQRDIFIGPVITSLEAVEYARSCGYCGPCTQEGMNLLAECKSAAFWANEYGFRYSEVFK
jgi:hypothetical protein